MSALGPGEGRSSGLRSVCNLDGLAAVLEAVVERCDAQDEEVRLLGSACRRVSEEQAALARGTVAGVDRVAAELARTRGGLKLELAPESESDLEFASDVTVGRVLGWQVAQLRRLRSALASRASAEDLARVDAGASRRVEALQKQVRLERASVDEMERLRGAQGTVVQQLEAVQLLLGSKLDKTELARVADVAERVRGFKTFHDDLQRRFDEGQTRMGLLAAEGEASARRIAALEAKLEQQGSSAGADVERLAALVVRLQAQVDACAGADAVALLGDQLRNVQQSVRRNRVACEAAERRRSEEADGDAVRASAARLESLEERLAALGVALQGALGRKAEATDVSGLASRTQAAEAQCELLEQKSELALRFIEWFSRKGEAFESNFSIIEENLNKLTRQSLPRVQSRKPLQPTTRLNRVAAAISAIKQAHDGQEKPPPYVAHQ